MLCCCSNLKRASEENVGVEGIVAHVRDVDARLREYVEASGRVERVECVHATRAVDLIPDGPSGPNVVLEPLDVRLTLDHIVLEVEVAQVRDDQERIGVDVAYAVGVQVEVLEVGKVAEQGEVVGVERDDARVGQVEYAQVDHGAHRVARIERRREHARVVQVDQLTAVAEAQPLQPGHARVAELRKLAERVVAEVHVGQVAGRAVDQLQIGRFLRDLIFAQVEKPQRVVFCVDGLVRQAVLELVVAEYELGDVERVLLEYGPVGGEMQRAAVERNALGRVVGARTLARAVDVGYGRVAVVALGSVWHVHAYAEHVLVEHVDT